ncbi:hypothetical protein [Salipaludibacillus neizhouensis]|uniref:hypothetical protein n=1 Tax=Salipaludibacillus neizhouensis TaxID=885475 RepID=UPI0016040A20|nr:hypothetical protein [Salipaludibacillus neizhouensis]
MGISESGKTYYQDFQEINHHMFLSNTMKEESELLVSRIKKRSIPIPTLKESLVSGEQYSINSNKQITVIQQLIIIVMTIVISEQLHNA